MREALVRVEEENAKTEAVIAAIGDGISVVDKNYTILYENEIQKELMGGHVGQFCYQAYRKQNAQCVDCPIARSFVDGQIHKCELVTPSQKGNINIEITASPLKDPLGRVVAGIEVIRDISGRRAMEESLRESEERLRLLMESTEDMIFMQDEDGRYLYFNGPAEYELTAKDLFGRTPHDFLDHDSADTIVERVQRVFATGQGITEELSIPWQERTLWFLDQLSPVRDSQGRMNAVVTISRNITKRKKMEEELQSAQKLESLGVLAGGLAHDFNNLLTAIMGNISLAKLSLKPGETTFDRLSEAEKASLRARDLTQQLLTFSRGGAPVKKAVSLESIIKDSASFSLRGSKARCEFGRTDGLWPVKADEGQISQVINNLVINAEQAMPGGGTISLSYENIALGPDDVPPLKAGNYVIISVRDQGIGVPKEHHGKIFDPYFTTKQKGSGLGLATCYSIIKQHEGHITVESHLGAGTAFHIYLPASEKEAPEQEAVVEAPAVGTGRILIMDDEEMVRDVAGKMLERLGYDVAFAIDGEEAVTLYRKAHDAGIAFDAVIMDLTIPGGMGGKEAIVKLLEIDPQAKAIVSSGYSNDPIMADCMQYGFSGVVTKPYSVKNLSEVLLEVLNRVTSNSTDSTVISESTDERRAC